MQMQLQTTSCQQTDGNLSLNKRYFGKTQPPSQILLVSMMLYGKVYPFSLFGFIIPALSNPKLLLICSLLAWGAEWETEKALMLCKQCSAIIKTGMLSTLFYSQIWNAGL